MKMIKKFTGANVTSDMMKYAVHTTFDSTDPTNDGLRNILEKVLEYEDEDLRDKFEFGLRLHDNQK